MTDQERIPILLTREDNDLILAAVLAQVEKERLVQNDPTPYKPKYVCDSSCRLRSYTAIAAQLRALDAGEGE